MATYVCLAGELMWEMQKRAKRSWMLIVELEVNAIAVSRMLEGRWVQIMVAMAPILSTILEEKTPEIAPRKLQMKRMYPISSKSRSYLV